MEEGQNNQGRRTTDPISIEFLVNTLVSIQSAISNIDKETSEKTEALKAVYENLTIITSNLRRLNEEAIRGDEKTNKLIYEVKTLALSLDKSALQLENTYAILSNEKNGDLKEIKYALQEINRNFVSLLAEIKVRNLKASEGEKKSVLKIVLDFLNGLKNLKIILVVICLITALLLTVLYGPDAAHIIINFVKKLV